MCMPVLRLAHLLFFNELRKIKPQQEPLSALPQQVLLP